MITRSFWPFPCRTMIWRHRNRDRCPEERDLPQADLPTRTALSRSIRCVPASRATDEVIHPRKSPATVQISPRFIPHSTRRLHRRTTGHVSREGSSPPPGTDGVRPGRRTSIARREPRSERDEARPSAIEYDAREPYRGMQIERRSAWKFLTVHVTALNPNFDGEEVGSREDAPVSAQESLPRRSFLPLRRRINAVCFRDVGNGPSADRVVHVGQGSLNARVTP
jgi:hypothetical protein